MFEFIENQGKVGTECEQIFGSYNGVSVMAKTWEKNAKLFHMAMMAGISDYVTGEPFSAEEYKAFSKGLAVIPDIMQKCLDEIVKKSKEESSEESSK